MHTHTVNVLALALLWGSQLGNTIMSSFLLVFGAILHNNPGSCVPKKVVACMVPIRLSIAAQLKNLDTENLVVEHIEVSRAPRGRRRTYRAHGRINAYMSSPCHIQLILREESKAVEKPKDKKIIRLSKKQMARRRIRVGGGNKA